MGEKQGGIYALAQEIPRGAGSFSAVLSVASFPGHCQDTAGKFVVPA